MHGLFIWIGCCVAYLYLILPIQMRFNQKYRANLDLEPVKLSSVLPDAAQYLLAIRQALESQGFETIGHFSWNNPAPNIFPLITLHTNRSHGVQAVSAIFYAVSARGAKVTARYVEFITRYEDGSVLLTTNNGTFGTFRRNPNHRILRVQKQQNPHDLYAIHRQRMARQAGSVIGALPTPDTELSTYKQRLLESFDKQVAFGRLYFDQAAEIYRPTWTGAYLMMWSQMWPMKTFRKKLVQREAQAELQSLGNAHADMYQV